MNIRYIKKKRSFWKIENLNSIAMWYDAQDGSTLYNTSNVSPPSNNQTVNKWINKGDTSILDRLYGSGTYLSSNINSKPSLDPTVYGFHNIIKQYTANNIPLFKNVSGISCYFVLRMISFSSASQVFFNSFEGTQSGSDRIRFGITSTQYPYCYSLGPGGNTGKSITGSTTISISTNWLIGARFNYSSSNLNLRINGTEEGTQTFSTTGNSKNSNIGTMVIGRNQGAGYGHNDQSFTGRIGEVLLLHQYIDDNNTNKLEGYLADKWGLSSSLPNDHPYKSKRPLV